MTAVEWLVEQLKVNNYISDNAHWLIDEAKEMEKEQLEDAFNESRLTHPMIKFKHEKFDDYYKETFKNK